MMSEQSKAATSNQTPYLKIDSVRKLFGDFVALDNVSLEVYEGEFICFLGPSGCGKTTFLRAIAGLDIQTSGTVHQGGKDVSALPPAERDFGIVFQSYALFPNLTVAKNIAFGLENQKLPKAVIDTRVTELLKLVNLPNQGKKYPSQLSGGEQQRVALTRALATSPGLLLLDEPLSALDAKVRTHLRHEMKSLQRRLGVTTIMVTHDQEEALTMADRIVVMNHGVIEQVGSPVEIYREPDTLFVADFIGEMNQIFGLVNDQNSVKLGELQLITKPHQLIPNANAIVTIRPEDIVPYEEGNRNAEEPGNVISGIVEDMEFLGSFWRVSIKNESLGESMLIADMSINAVRRMDVETGGTITVELPPERLLVFDKGS